MSAAEAGHREPPSLRQRALHEALRLVLIFLYLYVILGSFVAIESITLRERGISFAPAGFALINALVLAKVMLIGEDLKLGARVAHDHPLIVVILLQSLSFTLLLIVFRVIEDVTLGVIAGRTVAQSIPSLGGGGARGVLLIAFLFFIALIPYFGYTNLRRALGPGRLNAILFRMPDRAPG